MEKKVQILLSTYNGEKYLERQIDSLLNQSYEKIEIIVRDDGSSDSTRDILKHYETDNGVIVYYEDNIGLVKSFFRLLDNSDADYVAFCDQDDIWLPQKIEEAVSELEKYSGPALYASNKILIDSDDNVIPTKLGQKKLFPSFSNALVENICTGCTCVLNRKLTDIIVSSIPQSAVVHDWWIYLVATYFGNVYYDENSYIFYRQHGSNQIGAASGIWQLFLAKIKYIDNSRGKLGKQLEAFYDGFCLNCDVNDMCTAYKNRSIELLLNSKRGIKNRIKCIKEANINRQSKLDQIVMYVLILCNRLL